MPLLVISPYARTNYVNHSVTDQTSVLKFIEQNWLHGERIGGGCSTTSGPPGRPGGLLDFHARPRSRR